MSGYFKLPNDFVTRGTEPSWLAVLPGSAVKLLLALLRHADADGSSFPSWERLLAVTGLSRNGLRAAIMLLESNGLLACDRRPGQSTTYRLQTSALSALPTRGVETARSQEPSLLSAPALTPTSALSAPAPVRFLTPTSALFGQNQCAQETIRNTQEGIPKKEDCKEHSNGPESDTFTYPLEDGRDWKLSDGELHRFRTTFPRLDVDDELAKAKLWLICNPDMRKTRRGMPRFLCGWLNGASKSPTRTPQQRDVPPKKPVQAKTTWEGE